MRKKVLITSLIIIFSIVLRIEAQQIALDVDATDVARRILHARLVISTMPGPLALYYPKWIPGEHGPTGPITDLAGLKINADNKAIQWHRDETDMYAIHCVVPDGTKAIEVSLDFLSAPPLIGGFTSGCIATTQLTVINWNQLLLYPEGRSMREIEYKASLTLPEGWELATALLIESQSEQRTRFATVSLETLIDSPVLCGKHFREVPIGSTTDPPHFIEIACDGEAGLDLDPESKANFDRLVAEAHALFGAWHYKSYRFLVALTDLMIPFGLEHHESTDIRLPERALIDEKPRLGYFLFPHEFAHSWNGKYKRPADMVTLDFQQPVRTNLLWVYEGLTEYLGFVLAARSGFYTPEQFRDVLAYLSEWDQNQRGRSWRPLEDTTVAAQLLYNARPDWAAWRRGVDFYDEGLLIWLEIDTIIRQETQGQRSLDDLCRRFFGKQSGPPAVESYTLDDIAAALNDVASYDWKSFLMERVTSTTPQTSIGGIERSGWHLVYTDTPSEFQKLWDGICNRADLSASIGIWVSEDGSVIDIVPGKAADHAGIGPGMKLVAVNSRRFSLEVLKNAIKATKKDNQPLEFLVENGGFFASYSLDYHEGEKYPKLEQDTKQTDLLVQIVKPLTPIGSESK